MAEMTVVEFAQKHCTEHGELSAHEVEQHVNGIILAAMAMNRALWSVVLDVDGRASLVFVTLPEPVWQGLLIEAAKTRMLIQILGGLGL